MEIPVTQHHTHTPQQTNSWQTQDPHLPFHTEHLDPSVCSFHWVLNGCILNPRSPRNVLLGILYCFIRIPKVSFWLNGSPLRVPRLLRQVGAGLDEDQVGVGAAEGSVFGFEINKNRATEAVSHQEPLSWACQPLWSPFYAHMLSVFMNLHDSCVNIVISTWQLRKQAQRSNRGV